MTIPTTTTIRVSGPDAKDFLQGQLSNDLNRLNPGSQMLAAWCTPKGRVIVLLNVTLDEAAYNLQLPSELADDVIERLAVFRFRANVEFVNLKTESPHDSVAAIQSGLPWIGHEQSEKYTPHMLNLDLLDAISLDKGCYTGQEIVSRTHYKGATKRRTLRFECEEPLKVGDKVSLDGRDVGEVLNACGIDLLAVVPVDKADAELFVNGSRLEPRPIPYL